MVRCVGGDASGLSPDEQRRCHLGGRSARRSRPDRGWISKGRAGGCSQRCTGSELCLEATRQSNTSQNGDRLGRLLVAPQFEQALYGNEDRWEVLVNGRLNDGVRGVEAPMGEMVSHGSDVTPGDGRLSKEYQRIKILDRLADLDQSNTHRIEHAPHRTPFHRSADLGRGAHRLLLQLRECPRAVPRIFGSQRDSLTHDLFANSGLERV